MEIGSGYSNQNSIDLLIEQQMKLYRRPLDQLTSRRDELNSRKSALSDLNSKLSSLKNQSSKLIDTTVTNYLGTKKATSSDSALFTATASSSAQLGNHQLSVQRLATMDTRVSKQYTDTSSDFTGFLTDQTFSITVAHPTDVDSSNRETINVTIAAADLGGTNDDVLAAVAEAINAAMSEAIATETIENNELVRASVVSEEDGISRIVFRADQSGYTYRMDFSDSADNLLQALEVNSASQTSGASGGYITAVGTSASDSLLNAQLTMDGLTFYRNSNDITDILSGVSLRLLDTFATAETMTISGDTETVKKEVQTFLDTYNASMKSLRKYAITDPDTKVTGILARDTTYRNMIADLRQYSVATVTGATNTRYSKLYNIGIEADSTGNLSITDSSKFNAALEDNGNNISDLFQSTDGIATQLTTYLDGYIKSSGKIASTKKNIDSQLTLLNTHITQVEDRMVIKENNLRKEFASLQSAMNMLVNQQNFLSQFSFF